MVCTTCGAPMTLFRERGYFFCEYCGSFHFPEMRADGIRLLGEMQEGLCCPLCREPLVFAIFDDAYQGAQCPICRGIMLERFVFRDLVAHRRAAATTPPDKPQPRNPAEATRRLVCPHCGRVMDTHPYYGPGNIIIDTCHACNGIWLDPQELERVVNAPGNDRSSELNEARLPLHPLRPLPAYAAADDEIGLGDLLTSLFGNLLR